jgi:hypothetical protein
MKKGFFEDSDNEAILNELPDYMQGFVQFADWSGWREAQIRALTWSMAKIKERLINGLPRNRLKI